MDNFFDLDENIDPVDMIDINKLNDSSKLVYDTYLLITGLKELPQSDYVLLNQVSREYSVVSFCRIMKETIALKDSFIKAKNENRIKDFGYFKGWLNYFEKSKIKKENYKEKFKNIDKFIDDNKSNESFIILKQYIDDGKIPIINEIDANDMYNIFSVYSKEDIGDAIKDSKDIKGNIIYNLKFLFNILKKRKSNRERLEEIWEIEEKEMNNNIKSLFDQKEYIENETEEEKEYYKEINDKLIQDIKKLI
jgi:hypothetical protein